MTKGVSLAYAFIWIAANVISGNVRTSRSAGAVPVNSDKTKRVLVSIPIELVEPMQALAKRDNRSFSNWVATAAIEALAARSQTTDQS